MFRTAMRSLLDRLSIVRGNINRNDRHGAFLRSWSYVFTNHLIGDAYEFGVYRGDSLIASFLAWRELRRWLESQLTGPEEWRRAAAKQFSADHRFFACDTFSGMPANNEGAAQFQPGNFAADEKTVIARCAAAGLEAPQLVTVKGLFAHNDFSGNRPAVVLHVDGDLYQSARDALRSVTHLVQQGTVLLCDDYNCFNARRDAGERRALAEWCAGTGIVAEPWFSYHAVGQAFLLHRD